MVWSKNRGRFWAKTVKIDDFRFFGGGGGLVKNFSVLELTFKIDGGSNGVDRLPFRFSVVGISGPKFVQVDHF